MKSIIEFISEKQNFLIKGHTINQSDYVDLDLPSGLNWASCNIGATKPEEPGLLFQFGRTDGYKYHDKNNKFSNTNPPTTISGTEYKEGDTLDSKDDVAYQSTKGRLRMPTKDEIDELRKYTDNEWTELNGVKGRHFISKKDKSKWIFIPAAGYYEGFNGEFYDSGSYGYIWSSSIHANDSNSAYCLCFHSGNCSRDYDIRDDGQSVRGVLNK